MKNILLKSLVLVASIFLYEENCKAQDIHFSQFFETPLLQNPALAGIFSGDFRVQSVYRNQWNAVTVPYQTTSVSVEYKMPVGHGGDFLTIGGEILYDKSGTVALTATSILPVLNYHKSLSAERNMYLSAGFSAGIVQRKIDRSKITTNSQFNGGYDPTLPDGETFSSTGYSYFDGSAGLSFNSQIGENADNNIYFGAAYQHFNRSANLSFYNDSYNAELLPKIVLSAGLKMSASDYSYLTFYANYSKQGASTETMGGMLYSMKLDDPSEPHYTISGGAFIRWKDAIVPVVKFDVRPLVFALSYDVNVSQLKTASQGRGGFELSLSYLTFFDNNSSSREALRCPRF